MTVPECFVFLGAFALLGTSVFAENKEVTIKWLGHSAFLITSSGGVKIITDPYLAGAFNGAISYKPIKMEVDVVTISHNHADHNNTDGIKAGVICKDISERTVKGIRIYGVESSHGGARGSNVIYVIEVDGLRIVHLGDLGVELNGGQMKKIGRIDVLMVPVGGNFTIDSKTATRVIEVSKPSCVIPMHYKTGFVTLPIAEVADFVRDKKNVKTPDSDSISLSASSLPKNQGIIVLKPWK